MVQVEFNLPNEALAVVDGQIDQLATELRAAAAVKWYEVGCVSREVAAQIAGVSEGELASLMSSVNRPRAPIDVVRTSKVTIEAFRGGLLQLERARRMEAALDALRPLDETSTLRIVRDPAVCHGRLVIRGTRITVSSVIGSLAGGMPSAEIQSEYDLTAEDIRAALVFAVDLVNDARINPTSL